MTTKNEKISTGSLAKMIGRNRGSVQRWILRDDWPFGPNPWSSDQLPEILRWAADTLRERNDVPSIGDTSVTPEPAAAVVTDEIRQLRREKLEAEIRKLEAQASAAEIALGVERGELLNAGTVEDEWATIGNQIRTGFQTLAAQLANVALNQGMPIESASMFQVQADELINAALRKLSEEAR